MVVVVAVLVVFVTLVVPVAGGLVLEEASPLVGLSLLLLLFAMVIMKKVVKLDCTMNQNSK